MQPPQLVAPAPRQSIKVGRTISFRIRTHPGDKSLALRISRSPQIDALGLIGGEVQTASFSPTSDPSVYKATPSHPAGSWMDVPGTYYWQACRSVYGAGSDGAIESEVRSFTIKTPPPRKLSAARLEGQCGIELVIHSASGASNVARGQVYKLMWKFKPKCRRGSCRTKVDISSISSALKSGIVSLKRKGATYKKRKRMALKTCVTTPVPGSLKIDLRVTKGRWIGNRWHAAKIRGSLKHSTPSKQVLGFRCRGGRLSAKYRGVLVD